MELYPEEFESWWKKGKFYANLVFANEDNEKIYIDERFYVRDDSVRNIDQFICIFDASNYFGLYKYPIELYMYYLLNKEEVNEYFSRHSSTYQKLFWKRMVYNKEILLHRNDLIEYMKFMKDYIGHMFSNYEKKLDELEASEYYDVEYDFTTESSEYNGHQIVLRLYINGYQSIAAFSVSEYNKFGPFNSILALKLISEKIRNLVYFTYDDNSFEGEIYTFKGGRQIKIDMLNCDMFADLFEKLYYEGLELCKKEGFNNFLVKELYWTNNPKILKLNLEEYQKKVIEKFNYENDDDDNENNEKSDSNSDNDN